MAAQQVQQDRPLRYRSNRVSKTSIWSSTFSSPMVVATVTYAGVESPVDTNRIAARCFAGRCWWMVSPSWSVGV
ncbi:MAG TPA: hypothetical protein VIT42_01475 [Microlunatus sp.]